MRARVLFGPMLAASLLAAAPAAAVQPKPVPTEAPATTPAPPASDTVAPDSPRASVLRFLDLCRSGEYGEAAAQYLDLGDTDKGQGPALAQKLEAVLDTQMWGQVETVSPRSLGSRSEHLPEGVEEIGTIRGPAGKEPVRLVRRTTPEGARWVFSRATVQRIDGWYGRLRDRWVRRYLPAVLLRTGPEELLWWQWIALPILFALALGAGHVLGYLTRKAMGRAAARMEARWDDKLLARLSGPLTLAWGLIGVDLALPWLALYPPAEDFIGRVLRAGLYFALFWFAERAIDVGFARVLERDETRSNAAARSLVPLGARALKLALIAVAVISALSALGYPVASLVAGLGIGGIALALAAQKTVENLFGSLSIGVDQPFRVGDYIVVDSLSGAVESIGLRSTRVRTVDRTLVTIPNGKLADLRIESFAQRDRIKLGCTLPLDRGTKAAQVRVVLEDARKLLLAHPKIWPGPSVALARIGPQSLEIEVLAWFKTKDWDEFVTIREATLLGLLEVVEKAGAKLAPPGA